MADGWGAAAGLVGVLLGASLAPLLDWLRQRRTAAERRRTDLLELVASYLARTGDHLVAQADGTEADRWTAEVGANAARWRIQLLAPPPVAQVAATYAAATEALRKRLLAVGSWDGEQIAVEWDAWQAATVEMIAVARRHLTG
jgi:hypothetical protein